MMGFDAADNGGMFSGKAIVLRHLGMQFAFVTPPTPPGWQDS
jgi:hypothetical protein